MLRIFPFFLLITVVLSCSQNQQPVTKEEALSLSRAIDSAIKNKKSNYFNSLINETVFANKVLKISGIKVSPDMQQGVKEALQKSDLGYKIIEAVQANGFMNL